MPLFPWRKKDGNSRTVDEQATADSRSKLEDVLAGSRRQIAVLVEVRQEIAAINRRIQEGGNPVLRHPSTRKSSPRIRPR